MTEPAGVERAEAFDDVYSFTPNSVVVSAPGVLLNDKVDPSCTADQITARVVVEPESGTVQLKPDGSFVYTSNVQPNQPDKFVYELTDCHGQVITS